MTTPKPALRSKSNWFNVLVLIAEVFLLTFEADLGAEAAALAQKIIVFVAGAGNVVLRTFYTREPLRVFGRVPGVTSVVVLLCGVMFCGCATSGNLNCRRALRALPATAEYATQLAEIYAPPGGEEQQVKLSVGTMPLSEVMALVREGAAAVANIGLSFCPDDEGPTPAPDDEG